MADPRNTYTVHIRPVSKPRMTQRDRWANRPCVERYWTYKDELRAKMADFAFPDCGWHLTFYLPIPKSWSAKKKLAHEGQPHRQKPDKDNLEKGFLDALYEDDSGVWDGRVTKRWSAHPRIEITLTETPHP